MQGPAFFEVRDPARGWVAVWHSFTTVADWPRFVAKAADWIGPVRMVDARTGLVVREFHPSSKGAK